MVRDVFQKAGFAVLKAASDDAFRISFGLRFFQEVLPLKKGEQLQFQVSPGGVVKAVKRYF